MIIQDIRKRRKGIAALYIDEYEESPALVSYEILMRTGFRKGSFITEEELSELKTNSEQFKANEKALYLLEYRAHSKKELRDKIKRCYSEDAAENAVEKMESLGFIDDEYFARNTAKHLVEKKLYSDRLAIYELTHKGILKEEAQDAVSMCEMSEEERILTFIKKKYPDFYNANCDDKTRKRAVNALKRLGYSWQDIKTATSDLININSEE